MRLRSTLPTLTLLLALVIVGAGAAFLASASLRSYVGFQPPVAATPSARPATTGLSQGVVLVVVDGLRYDASLKMPYLNELRGRGAEYISEVTPPSISYPTWTTLLTGASASASGVTTNWHEGPVRIDTLFASARRASLTTGVVGSVGWNQLFAGQIDVERYAGLAASDASAGDKVIPVAYGGADVAADLKADSEVARAAIAVLRGEGAARPAFLVVHLLGVDEVGHAYGGSSDEYDQAAANVDALLREIAAALDLNATTLVVTADHGHVDEGGHGGAEAEAVRTPLVLTGKGIVRPRNAGRGPSVVRQVDVAPTLALLLGVGAPAGSEGRPLFVALGLDATERAARGVEVLVSRRNLALAYSDALAVAPPAPGLDLPARNALAGRFYAQAAADVEDALDRLDAWAEESRAERQTQDQVARLPIGILALVIPLAAAILVRPRRETFLALPFGAAYASASWLLFFSQGYGLSFSTVDQAGSVERFVLQRALVAVVLAVLLGVIVGLAYHRAGIPAVIHLSGRALFWAATLLVWQVAIVFVLYGATYRLYLPEPTLALVYFVDLIHLVGLGIATLPAVAVAGGTASLALGARAPDHAAVGK